MNNVAELEDVLSTPRPCLVDDLAQVDGDIIIIGAAGKLGPSLARLAARASAAGSAPRRIIAVSRFTNREVADDLAGSGVDVVPADIGADASLAALPDAPNVIYLVGAKFGTSGNEAHTWFTNVYLPGRVMRRYAGSRVVALSTGNVYPFVPAATGGCTEDAPPAPVGEYAMSCLGRERVITEASQSLGSPVTLVRLNYAIEPRYGVLADLAAAVLSGAPIDISMGQVNVVWQRYANEVVLRCLRIGTSPPAVLNVAGPETASVRSLAELLAARLGVATPTFAGDEQPTALLSNAARCHRLFGYPDMTLGELVDMVADWAAAGLPTHGKPTGFQQRDGRF